MTLSPRKSSDPSGGPFEKPTTDLYTVLLIIALLALIVCVVYLYAEMATYDFKLKAGAMWTARPAPTAIACQSYLPGFTAGKVAAPGNDGKRGMESTCPHPNPLPEGEGTALSA